MADLSHFIFTGRLTQDATVRTLATGKKVLNANVAINTGYGEYKKTMFVKVQMWGERGDKIVQYLKKGTAISCDGIPERNEYDTREGQHYVEFVVNTNEINFVGSKPQAQQSQDDSSTEYPDDIPF